jgi:hypothetical protein
MTDKWDRQEKLNTWLRNYYHGLHQSIPEEWIIEEKEEITSPSSHDNDAGRICYYCTKGEVKGHDYYVHKEKTRVIICLACKSEHKVTHDYDGPNYYDGIGDEELEYDARTKGGLCYDCLIEYEKMLEEERSKEEKRT